MGWDRSNRWSFGRIWTRIASRSTCLTLVIFIMPGCSSVSVFIFKCNSISRDMIDLRRGPPPGWGGDRGPTSQFVPRSAKARCNVCCHSFDLGRDIVESRRYMSRISGSYEGLTTPVTSVMTLSVAAGFRNRL